MTYMLTSELGGVNVFLLFTIYPNKDILLYVFYFIVLYSTHLGDNMIANETPTNTGICNEIAPVLHKVYIM